MTVPLQDPLKSRIDAATPEDLLFAVAADGAPPREPPAASPAGGLHRNPLPPARGARAPALRGEGPTNREPLPPPAEPRTRLPVSTREPAAPWAVPTTVLGVGLVAAACFSLLAHNYPVAIFIALLSIVGALLVRLLLQASIE